MDTMDPINFYPIFIKFGRHCSLVLKAQSLQVNEQEKILNNISKKKKIRFCVVGLISNDKKTVRFGVARLNPREQFVKKIGRAIAQGRAEKAPNAVFELKTPGSRKEAIKIGHIFISSFQI